RLRRSGIRRRRTHSLSHHSASPLSHHTVPAPQPHAGNMCGTSPQFSASCPSSYNCSRLSTEGRTGIRSSHQEQSSQRSASELSSPPHEALYQGHRRCQSQMTGTESPPPDFSVPPAIFHHTYVCLLSERSYLLFSLPDP